MKVTTELFPRSVLLTVLLCSHGFAAEELWFPSELLAVGESGETADLSRFSKGGQLPGTYKVSMYINQESLGMRDMNFVETDTAEKPVGITDGTGLMACLTRNDLNDAGVRPEAFGDMPKTQEEDRQCLSPGSVIPQATTHFDFQKMRLDISIPQKWVKKRSRNWVPPERWDEGITAGLLNYAFSGTQRQAIYGNSSSYYLNLHGGINVGPWRLRDEHTLNGYSGGSHRSQQWRHGRTWLERGIKTWRSTLTMGDTATDGDIFDSTGIRGVKLMTDDDMYPDAERGYAPVIRGTAMSNARIGIRQNGYLVSETNVAPGDFVIDDINPLYSSGDLEVTVTEADGSTRLFTVPYAIVPNLLREGRMKYAFNAGQLQESGRSESARPAVVQGTLTRGLPFGMTAYGGMQYTRNYQAAALGTGVNMGNWGAVSTDITHADSMLVDNSRRRGQSVRFLYSRGFHTTGTTFQLAGYRYSTRGFYTLEESNRAVMRGWRREQEYDADGRPLPRRTSDWYDLNDSRRERVDASLSQRIGDNSSLYLTGSRQTYWSGRANTSLQTGYSSSLGLVGYSLSYSESYSSSPKQTDRNLFASLSIPLRSLFPGNGSSMHASLSTGRNSSGEITQQAGLSGSIAELNNLSWSASQGYSRQSGNNGDFSLSYRGGYGSLSTGYSQGRDYKQGNYAVAGGLLLHSGGLTAGQSLGHTNVLVSVPGTSGVPLEGGRAKTDWRGYAVQPWASQFRENWVRLDVAHLDAQTEVAEPVTRVIPTKGAIVRTEFTAKTGLRVLMTLMKNGKPLPFGATVSAGDSSGIVGDNGQVYLSGLSRTGTLTVIWGAGDEQTCRANWHISKSAQAAPLVQATAVCQ